MKRIDAAFVDLKDANKFQEKLYRKYNVVKLIHVPIHVGIGTFSWIVDSEIKQLNLRQWQKECMRCIHWIEIAFLNGSTMA